MSNLNPLSVALNASLIFLEQHPSLADSLLSDCNYDLDEVTAILEPVLEAPKRCQLTPFYIQAVSLGQTRFLVTNLAESQPTKVTDVASSWLIGRSATCAITVQHKSVSRRHVVMGHHPSEGLFVTDIGSKNGTWVNRRQLTPTERRVLRDGDLLQLGMLQVEFFLANLGKPPESPGQTTYS
jgi:hypothetical protein